MSALLRSDPVCVCSWDPILSLSIAYKRAILEPFWSHYDGGELLGPILGEMCALRGVRSVLLGTDPVCACVYALGA